MAKISDEQIKSLKESVSIVDLIGSFIPLKKTGQIYVGNCPFHPDKNPSFIVYPKTDSFHCFGCGAGKKSNGISGDAIGFIMGYQKVSFKEAITYLKNFSGMPRIVSSLKIKKGECSIKEISLVTTKIYRCATDFYHSQLLENPFSYYYLTTIRGYSDRLIRHFRIGYASGGYVLFQHLKASGYKKKDILNSGLVRVRKNKCLDFFWGGVVIYPHYIDGKVIAFSMKDPDEKRNFRWKLGYNNHFFNQDVLKKHKFVIIVEGEHDLLQLYNQGKKNVVALCGTHFNQIHRDILIQHGIKEVTLALDDDDAGKKATEKITEILKNTILVKQSVFRKEGII